MHAHGVRDETVSSAASRNIKLRHSYGRYGNFSPFIFHRGTGTGRKLKPACADGMGWEYTTDWSDGTGD